MENYKTIVTTEKNICDCIKYMENKIKDIIENLIEQNKKELLNTTEADYKGYLDGIHDGLLEVLNALEIETDEEYYHTTEKLKYRVGVEFEEK